MPELLHKKIPLSDPAAWNEALHNLPHSFFHRHSACQAASLTTGHECYLHVWRRPDGSVVAACPVAVRQFLGQKDLLTPIGFSGFTISTEQKVDILLLLHTIAADHDAVCVYIAQHPKTVPEDSLNYFHSEQSSLYFIDLTRGARHAVEHASKNRRRELRRWIERNPLVYHDKNFLGQFLIDHHQSFMDRVNGSKASRMSLAGLNFWTQNNDVVLFGVGDRGISHPQAIALIGCAQTSAEGVILLSLPGCRSHYVGLLAHTFDLLARRGVSWFNLGGVGTENDAMAMAKNQWNPEVIGFSRIKFIADPSRYQSLCAAAKVPEGLQAYFPSYHHPALRFLDSE